MKRILMLDLEGMLIATAIPKRVHRFSDDTAVHPQTDYGVRPHAHEFLAAVSAMFDEIYLSTIVEKERALAIMHHIFKRDDVKYNEWQHVGNYQKASTYNRFAGHTLVHVEDGISDAEHTRIAQLGFRYIPVRHWGVKEAYVEKRTEDEGLPRALHAISEYLANVDGELLDGPA